MAFSNSSIWNFIKISSSLWKFEWRQEEKHKSLLVKKVWTLEESSTKLEKKQNPMHWPEDSNAQIQMRGHTQNSLPLIPTDYDSDKTPFNSKSSDQFCEECSVSHMILCIRRLVSKLTKIFAQSQSKNTLVFWPAFLIIIKHFFSWKMIIHLHRVKLISAKNCYLKSTRKWQVFKQFWKLLNTTQLN